MSILTICERVACRATADEYSRLVDRVAESDVVPAGMVAQLVAENTRLREVVDVVREEIVASGSGHSDCGDETCVMCRLRRMIVSIDGPEA